MATTEPNYEETERFSSNLDGYGSPYDYKNPAMNDTDFLNLDEDRQVASAEAFSELEEETREVIEQEEEPEESIQLSPDGILDEETVARGLSNLGRSADGTQQVFLHLTLPGYSLRDISILQDFIHIQKLEIAHNELTELTALSYMPHLLELDASHNLLSSVLDFTPPKNLKSVDLSYNQLEDIGDLSCHHYLTKLILDNNQIRQIQGLDNCKRLSHLSIAHNKLIQISNLQYLPIKYLDLSNNYIEKVENMETLRFLQTVKFAGNKIRSLEGLHDHEFLEEIDMEGNEVIDLSEIQYIKYLPLLRILNLLRNPIRELPDYRLSILFHLQKISELDRRKVDTDEKVASCNMFSPPMEVIAARDHIMHVVYSFLQPSRVLDSTLPSVDTPYPMLVLCGPQGAGKKDLALKLVDEFPDYFGYGVSHTTRRPYSEEVDAKDYNFVTLDQFENDVKMGKFLQTYNNHGNLYGLTIDSVESVAREGLACVLHMELEGVLTLKNTYLEPRYVLIMPLNSDAHEKRLRERCVYSESQIALTLKKAETYAEHNRTHPGFFDMMINSDDITDAYRRLRRLVMDYLGITPASPSDTLAQSNTTSAFGLEKETTDMTTVAGSAAGGRAWSKASMPDSAPQLFGIMRTKTISPMPVTGKSIVEEESLRRRQSAAKDAVSGNRPSLYEQLIGDAPRTAPQSVNAMLGLGDEDISRRAFSAPGPGYTMDDLPPGSPDSSENQQDSSLSNLSEAGGRNPDADTPVDSLEDGSARGDHVLPDEALDPIELMSSNASKSNGPMAPRPGTGERHNSLTDLAGSRPVSEAKAGSRSASAMSAGRPGSDRHPVLPPISPQNTQIVPDY